VAHASGEAALERFVSKGGDGWPCVPPPGSGRWVDGLRNQGHVDDMATICKTYQDRIEQEVWEPIDDWIKTTGGCPEFCVRGIA